MGFPILKLPVVALKVLVDHLNDVELLQLFLLECKRQGGLPEWNFNLRCRMEGRYEQLLRICCNVFDVPIYFDNLRKYDKPEGFKKYLKIGELLVPVYIFYSTLVFTVWESKIDGLIQLLGYFETQLNLPIEHLKLPGKDIEAMERVVKHINSTQTVVKNVLVERYPQLPDYCGEFILENVSATEKLCFNSKLGQEFEFYEGIRAKTIKIRFGHWFTIESLLRSNESEVIHVKGSNYAREELRWFLSQWKAGKLPKLKEVTLSTRVSARDVTGGFERWVERCGKCGFSDISIISIKGYGGFHGSVDASRGCFHMTIHSNK
ncbi:hypothetical protein CAEBREN_24252 [Caenorhabditis brenneri]|uniref:Sdz-33 F-box domain-containing protein n=1 Tax=Caenorhabditis brenneri TaxID=135651 RepID=G0NSK2_CAEBE|nr:hypothetical protein CAEBREN_24252 [Caenorhabditis brenneri]